MIALEVYHSRDLSQKVQSVKAQDLWLVCDLVLLFPCQGLTESLFVKKSLNGDVYTHTDQTLWKEAVYQ